MSEIKTHNARGNEMRLEVVNGLVSFVGKVKETKKAEKAISIISKELGLDTNCLMDNGDDYEMDLGVCYDMDEWSVEDCKAAWRRVKKQM